MKKYILFFAFSLLVTGLTSCDDGRIYENTGFVPREGRVLKLSGKFSGINKWSEGYSIVVAGFDDESEYAIVSKVIPTPETDGGEVEVILSGISEEVTVDFVEPRHDIYAFFGTDFCGDALILRGEVIEKSPRVGAVKMHP